jgi:hypothetical protein
MLQVRQQIGGQLMATFSKPLTTGYQKCAITRDFGRVSEGTRTPDRLDHNQELYQLSYAHRVHDQFISAIVAGSSNSHRPAPGLVAKRAPPTAVAASTVIPGLIAGLYPSVSARAQAIAAS